MALGAFGAPGPRHYTDDEPGHDPDHHGHDHHHHHCFAPDSTTVTNDPAVPIKSMQDLRVGDHVLATNARGELVYSPVIAFLDKDVSKKGSFVKVQSEDGHTLMLTPYHLIFRNNSEKPVFASHLQPGDHVYTLDSESQTMQISKVTAVETAVSSTASGVYGPMTEEGTIVVDGILASCYALVEDQQLIHGAFAPLRYMNYLLPGLVGMEPTKIHWYPKLLQTGSTFLYESGLLPHSIVQRTGTLVYH